MQKALTLCGGVQIEVRAWSEEELRTWDGWVHSRLRQLVIRLEQAVLVRPWPNSIAPTAGSSTAPAGTCRTFWYMGLKKKQQYRPAGARAAAVDLNGPVSAFRDTVCLAYLPACSRTAAQNALSL